MGKHNNNNRNNNWQNSQNQNNQQNKRPPKAPQRYKGNNIDPMGDIGRMGKYAIGIFKDMAKGKIKPVSAYTEFNNKEFIRGAIDEVLIKIREHQIYLYSLRAVYNGSTDPQVNGMIGKHAKAIEGWTYIYNSMNTMLMSGDTGILLGLINRLPDYRHVLY